MPTKFIHSTAEADDIHEQLLPEKNKYNTNTTFLTTYFISLYIFSITDIHTVRAGVL